MSETTQLTNMSVGLAIEDLLRSINLPLLPERLAGGRDSLMIRNLVQDERIPSEARVYAEQVLSARLKSVLVAYGLGSLARRNPNDTFKVAEVLGNHYGLRGRARLLRFAASTCRIFPPASYPVAAIRKLRNSLRDAAWRPSRRQLQQEYGAYARYLEL